MISAPDYLHYLRGYADWARLLSTLMICNQRKIDDQVTQETHYSVASLVGAAKRFLQSKRSH